MAFLEIWDIDWRVIFSGMKLIILPRRAPEWHHRTSGTSILLTSVAFWARPALQAGLVAVVVTGVVAEELVARPAELVAAETVIVLVAGDPDLVLELGHGPVVLQALPLPVRVDHAGLDRPLDHLTSTI